MVGYDKDDNALTLGDDDSIAVGDYELKYSSTDDEWQAEYGRPIGGELGNHGEIIGARYVSGIVGEKALTFNDTGGQTDYVRVPHNESLNFGDENAFSISASVDLDSVSGDGNIVRKGLDSGTLFEYALIVRDGQAGVFISDGNGSSESVTAGTINTNQETHIVGTYDGTDLNIYIDGSNVGTSTTTIDVQSNTADMIIGSRNRFLDDFVSGILDDVRLYNRELSSSEVSDLSNKVNVSSGLVARYNFEFPETPNVAIDSTGDIFPNNAIPRSTSGSLVPEGFADVLSNGEVLADNGEIYTSVQDAVNAASGFVFVGPGTFNESVTISTAGLTLTGVGDGALVDAGSSGDAVSINAADVTVENISVRSDFNSTSKTIITQSGADSATIQDVHITESGGSGIEISHGTNHRISNCTITGQIDGPGITCTVDGVIVRNCVLNARTELHGILLNTDSDDCVLANNIIIDTGASGIYVRFTSSDTVVVGNRVINAGANGILVHSNSADNILANNRVSGSRNVDIEDRGTGNVLDGNLTGPSN